MQTHMNIWFWDLRFYFYGLSRCCWSVINYIDIHTHFFMGLYSASLLCAKLEHAFTYNHNVMITWYTGSSHSCSPLAEMILWNSNMSVMSLCYDLRMCFLSFAFVSSVMQAVLLSYHCLSLTFSPFIHLFHVITVSGKQRVHCSLLFSQSNRILSASAVFVWGWEREEEKKRCERARRAGRSTEYLY